MSALRELIAFFGVEVDDKKLDHAGEKMEGLAKIAERAAATIGLAFGLHEIAEFTKGQIELGAELLHTSEILGLGVEELQAFQYAAKNAGLGADEANTALRFLNKNVGAAIEGGGDGAAAFQKLGVKLKDANGQTRDTKDILADVADGFEKLHSPQEKTAKAMEIFGRAGARMIPLLNKGSKGIQEFYEEFEQLGGGLDKEFVEAAEKGEHQMNKLALAWKGAKATIAAQLLPAFTWLVDAVTNATRWFREFSKHSYIVQTALGTLAVIVGALALVWTVMNIEIILVVAAIALLILVVDDVYTAFQGGKSVIGDFIDSMFGVGATAELVELLKSVAEALWIDLKALWEAAKDLVGALGELGGESTKTKGGLEGIKSTILGITGVVREAIQFVTDLIKTFTDLSKKYADFKKEHPDIAKAIDNFAGTFNPVGTAGKSIKELWNGAQDLGLVGGAPALPAPAGLSTVAHNGDVINRTEIRVDVKTTGSPKETGNEVAAGVRRGIDGSDLQAARAGVVGGGGL